MNGERRTWVELHNTAMIRRLSGDPSLSMPVNDVLLNHDLLVRPVEPERRIIRPGLTLTTASIPLGKDRYTNMYDLTLDPYAAVTPHVHLSEKPFYLRTHMRRDPSIAAAINGGFFFLVDRDPAVPPKTVHDHLAMSDGNVEGLPSVDRPAAFVRNGQMEVVPMIAAGTIAVGGVPIEWIGAKSSYEPDGVTNEYIKREATEEVYRDDVIGLVTAIKPFRESSDTHAVLYNAACATLVNEKSRVPGTKLQIVVESMNTTPTDRGVVDVIVNKDEDGKLRVSKLKKGGGTNFFEGMFVLQCNSIIAGFFEVGDEVTPQTLVVGKPEDPETHHDLMMSDISSAMTVGIDVHDIAYNRTGARSVIFKDRAEGKLHFTVFDGAPMSQHMPGPDALELQHILLPREQVEWAYLLDSGKSSKVAVRNDDGGVDVFGNLTYVPWGLGKDDFVMNGPNGRHMYSSIVLH